VEGGRSGASEAEARGVAGMRIRSEPFFPINQWQWWVIFPNSTKFCFVECLKRYSTKSMDLRPGSTFFLEQIRGGAAGAGCVWLEKVGVELFFWIWGCLELSQTRPYILYFIFLYFFCAYTFCSHSFSSLYIFLIFVFYYSLRSYLVVTFINSNLSWPALYKEKQR
jgi:hypothetical protein